MKNKIDINSYSLKRLRGSMDYISLFWILWVIIIYIIIKKTNKKNFLFFLLVLMMFFPVIRSPIIFILTEAFILFFGSMKDHRYSTIFLFHTCIKPVLLGNNIIPKKQTILIANYPSNYIEYLLPYLFSKKICIVLYKNAFIQSRISPYFYDKNSILFIDKKNHFEETQKKIKEKILQGYHILAYVERHYWTREDIYSINSYPLHSGIFRIAKNIDCTITPIVFDHVEHNMGIINNDNFKIYIDKTRRVKNIDFEIKNVRKLFTRKLNIFKLKI